MKQQNDIIEQLNDTSADFPKDKCIHVIFEEQVLQTPHSTAVFSGESSITFEKLNERANQLAHYIKEKGIGQGSIVAVSHERSIETIICLMGILKSGAAYLPVDPAYPAERIEYLLKDSKADLLITHSKFGKLFHSNEVNTINIDNELSEIEKSRIENPGIEINSESPAYIIYTSGSTGKPKGVIGSHRASINRFYWMWQTYPFAEDEVCCQKTSLSFVDSIWEIFGPILKGVKLVVIGNNELRDTEKLIKILAEEKVSRIVLVPSLLRVMLETMNQLKHLLPNLRLWVSSGEALTLELYRDFKVLIPDSKLINLYGSSEVAADVTVFDTDQTGELKFIPLGKPINNCEVYILDENLKHVPIGETGELYVTGECLSKGYLNNPELTKERFIHNPFGKYDLMYKTGDIVRLHDDGNIEYSGRADNQVKLRGYRIELGEIESEINKIKGVKESIVTLSSYLNTAEYLKAFIVSKNTDNLDKSLIRKTLNAKLPEYMIPSEMIILDELPLTPNGKIDRNKLKFYTGENQKELRLKIQPANETEYEVREIWKEVMGSDEIGVTENFFEIGGHSLIATKIISRIRYSFDIDLPLKTIFDKPTIRDISDEIITMITEEILMLDEDEASRLLSLQE